MRASSPLLTAILLGRVLAGPVHSSVYEFPEEGGRPGPASKVLAGDCPSVDPAALEGDDLTDYLRTTSKPCVDRTITIAGNPSIRDDLPTIYSDRNLRSVLSEIERLAVTYDGTNSAGMLQLWRYVQVAYTYMRHFPSLGVGPFDAATDRAYLAASDALAASDHFYDPDDEAAWILYYYFHAAHGARFRQNHLAPVKRVLSGFTAERAVTESDEWSPQSWAFINVLQLVRTAFEDSDREFISAAAEDPGFIEAILRVTRYDFFFYLDGDDRFHERIEYLDQAVDVLVRLAQETSSRESAISALKAIVAEQERLSSAFLVAAKALEGRVDCGSLNICREVIEREILEGAVPHTYSFDGGTLVFQTYLYPLEEVLPLYHGIKEVQAQFHRLVGTDNPAGGGKDVFTAIIYGNRFDYQVFESYRIGAETRGIHVGGIYKSGEMSSWIRRRPGDLTVYNDSVEEVVRHEYAHYLADRFGLLSFGGPWFDEGLAEFLMGSTQAEGVRVRRTSVSGSAGRELRLSVAGLFNSRYSAGWDGGVFYNFAAVFFHFMYQERRTELLDLLDLVRSGDSRSYFEQLEEWKGDSRLAEAYDAFMDDQIGRTDLLGDLPPADFIPRDILTSESVDEIESALRQIDGVLDLGCRAVDSELYPSFRCSGRLAAHTGFTGDRGALNEHFNDRLDTIIGAALGHEQINNFQDMNCYFADATGHPPVADLSCDGPLRPAGLPTTDVWDGPGWGVPLPDWATFRLGRGGLGAGLGAEVAFSADGRRLAVPSSLGLWLYDVATAREIALLPYGWVSSAAFSPDGATLAAGARDGNILLWDAATGERTATLHGDDGEVRSLVYSPDGAALAAVARTVRLWDLARGEVTVTLDGGVRSVAFSPDGAVLAILSGDGGSVRLWDLAAAASIATLNDGSEMESVAFSPDGETLATGSWSGVKLWDVEQGQEIASLEGHTGKISSVAFSPDGATLAAGSRNKAVWLWDVASRRQVASVTHSDAVRSVVFSKDGVTLAVTPWRGDIQLLNLATRTAARVQGHALSFNSLAFSPDGVTLATGSGSVVKLWDVRTGRETATLETGPVAAVAFTPDGVTLAVARGQVALYDVASTEIIGVLTPGAANGPLALSPDGGTLAAGSWRGTVLWDLAAGEQIANLEGGIESAAFSPDGAILAMGRSDGTTRLWDLEARQEIVRLESVEVSSLAFSPEGGILAIGSRDGSVRLLEAGSWSELETLRGESGVHSLTFFPDGATLAAGSGDGTVRLWNAESGRRGLTLEGHTHEVGSLAFSRDGVTLASGSRDGTVLLWDLTPQPYRLSKVSGDAQEGGPGELLPGSLVVEVMDQNGQPLEGARVTFTLTGGGTLTTGTATTDARGRAATELTLGNDPGPNTVEVTATDLEPVIFTARTRSVPTTLSKVEGDGQQGASGEALAGPFVVSVLDQSGEPLASAVVTFSVTDGGGSLSATTDTTGIGGRAATTLTLGPDQGINTVTVTVAGLDPVTFSAVGEAVPRSLARLSGDGQQAEPGGQLAEALVVSVQDQTGTVLAGAVVRFALVGDGGTLSAAADTTDVEGRAAVFLTLGEEPGTYTVEVTVEGLEPVTFKATAKPSPDFDGDGITGFSDFFLFAEAFGGSDPRFDLDASGVVDFADFFLFAESFGQPARARLLALARDRIGLPGEVRLQQNAPNPFNSQTVITWFLLAPGPARLEVFALTGQRVAVLREGPLKAGFHRLRWEGRDAWGRPLASGVYVCRLVTADAVDTRKLTLLR